MTIREFAESIYQRKIDDGRFSSPATIVRWREVLDLHIFPYIGHIRPEDLKYQDLLVLRSMLRTMAPSSANQVLGIVRQLTKRMYVELDLPTRDPGPGLEDFPIVSRTYTYEQPNSLTPAEVSVFLAHMRDLYPGLYPMVRTMFFTGVRPSHLRPIRVKEDIHGDRMYIRRSNARRSIVSNRTKTGKDQVLCVPFLAELPRGVVYLFELTPGRMIPVWALQRPFADVQKRMGLEKKITPRAGRRTFQDLTRLAGVPDLVTRSISGHATASMQAHYSTAYASEQAAAITRIMETI